jgi:hypothetical protein
LISAAPFSAIMIVGALVLVEVTAGITEAPMPEALKAVDAQFAVDDAHRVCANEAGAAGVVAGAAVAPCIVEQFVVALDLRARQALFPHVLV